MLFCLAAGLQHRNTNQPNLALLQTKEKVAWKKKRGNFVQHILHQDLQGSNWSNFMALN